MDTHIFLHDKQIFIKNKYSNLKNEYCIEYVESFQMKPKIVCKCNSYKTYHAVTKLKKHKP